LTPLPFRRLQEANKPDTADYLGDSEELDEFAVHQSSDENLDGNKEPTANVETEYF